MVLFQKMAEFFQGGGIFSILFTESIFPFIPAGKFLCALRPLNFSHPEFPETRLLFLIESYGIFQVTVSAVLIDDFFFQHQESRGKVGLFGSLKAQLDDRIFSHL